MGASECIIDGSRGDFCGTIALKCDPGEGAIINGRRLPQLFLLAIGEVILKTVEFAVTQKYIARERIRYIKISPFGAACLFGQGVLSEGNKPSNEDGHTSFDDVDMSSITDEKDNFSLMVMPTGLHDFEIIVLDKDGEVLANWYRNSLDEFNIPSYKAIMGLDFLKQIFESAMRDKDVGRVVLALDELINRGKKDFVIEWSTHFSGQEVEPNNLAYIAVALYLVTRCEEQDLQQCGEKLYEKIISEM